MVKFTQGGWVPLVLALVIFTAMWTWLQGRLAVAAREKEGALPLEALLGSIGPGRVHRPQGTAVYLTAFSGNAPNCLLHNLKHNEVLHEHVVLLTVEVPDEPYVAPEARAQITHLGKGVHRVVLRYGFMEQPDVPRDLAPLADKGVPFDPMRTSYFVGRNSFVEVEPPAAAALAAETVPHPRPLRRQRRRLLPPARQPRGRTRQPHRDLGARRKVDHFARHPKRCFVSTNVSTRYGQAADSRSQSSRRICGCGRFVDTRCARLHASKPDSEIGSDIGGCSPRASSSPRWRAADRRAGRARRCWELARS